MNRTQMVILGVAAGAVVLFLWWKGRKVADALKEGDGIVGLDDMIGAGQEAPQLRPADASISTSLTDAAISAARAAASPTASAPRDQLPLTAVDYTDARDTLDRTQGASMRDAIPESLASSNLSVSPYTAVSGGQLLALSDPDGAAVAQSAIAESAGDLPLYLVPYSSPSTPAPIVE